MSSGSRFYLEKTKSWWFLTPMFELDQYNLNYKYLLNVYLGTEDYPEHKNILVLHYDFIQIGGNFAKLEKRLSSLPNFIRSYDPDDYTSLFLFHIPHKWYNDYLLFINGKYSQLSGEYKNLLFSFYAMGGNKKHLEELKKVVNKSEEKKLLLEEELGVILPADAEVASIINWEKEIYNESHKIKDPLDKTEFFNF